MDLLLAVLIQERVYDRETEDYVTPHHSSRDTLLGSLGERAYD